MHQHFLVVIRFKSVMFIAIFAVLDFTCVKSLLVKHMVFASEFFGMVLTSDATYLSGIP